MADTRPERRFTRIDRLPPYVFNITAELKMAARRRGEDIIDFSMGNPDGATPPHIVEKLCTVAQRPDTHGYSTSRGIPRLRRAISRWYQDRYDVEIDPESEAIVTIGSKEGLAHLMLATLDHGDTVLVPNPSYPIHIYGAVIAGAQVRSVPLVEGVDFFNELERAIRESYPKPKMMILGFPSNPTAQCVELEFFEKVVALAKRYDVLVVHDLAYADIVYDGWKAPSIMQVPGARDVAVEFFTLSKSYNMAGWRIGFMVGNKTLVSALARIKSYHDYGTFTPLQVAAIAALEGDQQCVRDIAEQYKRRRDVLVKGLHEAGWMVEMPKASMYVWAKIPEPYAAMGSLVNVRIIAVMSGGILFGPWVGIITGVIAGIHRYLIDIGGVTAIPCFITSILAGCISGWINLKIPKAQRWRVGILGGMLCETLTMILVIVWAPTTALGIDIVSKIGIPMILGSVCIGFIVLLVQSVEGEKEASAARQAKLALDIANKTLPLFRHVNSESLRKVCEIIRDDIHADAVAMTNTDHVLAYVGVGEHNYQNGDDFISPTTRQAMNYGKIIIKNNDEAHRTPEIHSMLVIPLWEKGVVTGTLKIYYCHAHQITSSLQEMAVGLSQIISTQLEVSRAEQLREMANKAELRALQSKINPHFLFNALNAISSSIRLNPDTARQLIFNLSRYLRYNIELKDDEQIDIKKELYQIKDYIAIEQARFGDKLTVIYDIDEEVNCCIPSLLIQPLVENAIVHGIQPCKGKGVVTISVAECGNRVRIAVRDTGHGIDPKVIERVEANEMPGNKIGLLNVHHRVKLLYGEGLHIRRLEPGTEIAFYIPNQRTPVASQATLLL
ncbi:alanine transaminase [Escherichia coli]|nr:alanine transaminase [Escherichia coli]